MNADLLDRVRELSVSDRLELIEAIWDTLSHDDIPITDEDRALIDERLADAERSPDDQRPWEDVRARLGLPRR
jgi:putative addiction module component (TIGR02574 family)